MSYYRLLGLETEPFSTSPDPAFLFEARDHKAALYRLLISLRLRRGLSLILGDVGTGKTTLSRRLYQIASQDSSYDFHIILNPVFHSETEFLLKLAELFHLELPTKGLFTGQFLDLIEKELFKRSVEGGKTIIILIDEAQKLDRSSLEILRTLLNYETNEHKLLQLILMSQLELLPKIVDIKNLWDRISLKYMLNPLSLAEMKEMIAFRLRHAGYEARKPLFSDDALEMVYHHSQGYPRKATSLCHNILERLVMDNEEMATRQLVQKVIAEEGVILRAATVAATLSP